MRCHCSFLRRPVLISSTSQTKRDKGSSVRSGGRGKLSQSSRNWLQRQEKDVYSKKARKEGSPSRSIFKLEEIVKNMNTFNKRKSKGIKFNFLQKDDVVIDLGAAPGGWSLYASRLLGGKGLLISVDLLPLDSNVVNKIATEEKMPSFHAIEGDFTHYTVKQSIMDIVSSHEMSNQNLDESVGKVDCIISDMAANFTGDKSTDALRTMNLCEDAMMFAAGSSCFDDEVDKNNDDAMLRIGGTFLCKFFACGQDDEKDLMTAAKSRFQYTNIFKPKSSRKESAELFLLATGYRVNNNC